MGANGLKNFRASRVRGTFDPESLQRVWQLSAYKCGCTEVYNRPYTSILNYNLDVTIHQL